MSLPKTLYVRRAQLVPLEAGKTHHLTVKAKSGVVFVYIANEELTDFDDLKDEPIGCYELKNVERLSISGPGKQEEKRG